jgi:hypothetical protein
MDFQPQFDHKTARPDRHPALKSDNFVAQWGGIDSGMGCDLVMSARMNGFRTMEGAQ